MKTPNIEISWAGSPDPEDGTGNARLVYAGNGMNLELDSFRDAYRLQVFVQSAAEFYYRQGLIDAHARIQYSLDLIKEETFK